MENDVKEKIEVFNERLNKLYAEISIWAEDVGLSVQQIEKTNVEERSGEYKTKRLLIFKDNKKIAELNPIGIWIIGADARVDMETNVSKETFAYLSEGGPSISSSISVGNEESEKSFRYMYKDVREGWHWIDDRIIGKIPLLNKDVFLNVLDYAS